MVKSKLKIIDRVRSTRDEGTIKYLIELRDKKYIECVLFPYSSSLMLCVSSQVGCPVKCAYCRTGKDPFIRNLTAQEIIDQFIVVQKDIERDYLSNTKYKKIDTILYMGMGEPLLNYINVIKSIRSLESYSISNFSISTVGIVPKIKKLSKEKKLNIKLFISLNAADDITRKKLIPSVPYSIKEILKATEYYASHVKTNIPPTISYLLLDGINDSREDAKKFANLIKNKPFKAYIKEYCDIGDPHFRPSTKTKEFKQVLDSYGIDSKIMGSMGQDIKAGCGQLRQYYLKQRSQDNLLSADKYS